MNLPQIELKKNLSITILNHYFHFSRKAVSSACASGVVPTSYFWMKLKNSY
ncbi:TPA: hypothetical protein U1C21_000636 [Streptococcus suis]|uniref:hypothetical protein n=1 Tax=Streptococcus parasuis TaxID=1501662 RepID=UPI002379B186|nr:hypothetical protein [Streptococcus parasuis]WDN57924.1 hypothetical protein LOD77_06490 [Streptococcus parasuis]HEM3598027.1 hypothetical protein [Streptococcus suis]HEM3616126.1 hypothetical protein [Streptococcus suis]HEM3655194.1 hypothetical protein [Streptococcus suis]